MGHDRGITGRLGIGNRGIAGGEDHFADGLQRDPLMPGIQPDERLSPGGRTVGSRVDVDGLVDGISRSSFQGVLYLPLWIHVIRGGLCIKAHAVADCGCGPVLFLASEGTDG